MIRLNESGRQRDGSWWRAKVRAGARSALAQGAVYDGLGPDAVTGFVWIIDGKRVRCVAEGELEPVEEERSGNEE